MNETKQANERPTQEEIDRLTNRLTESLFRSLPALDRQNSEDPTVVIGFAGGYGEVRIYYYTATANPWTVESRASEWFAAQADGITVPDEWNAEGTFETPLAALLFVANKFLGWTR